MTKTKQTIECKTKWMGVCGCICHCGLKNCGFEHEGSCVDCQSLCEWGGLCSVNQALGGHNHTGNDCECICHKESFDNCMICNCRRTKTPDKQDHIVGGDKKAEQEEDWTDRFDKLDEELKDAVGGITMMRIYNFIKEEISSERSKAYGEGYEKNEMVLGKAHEIGRKDAAREILGMIETTETDDHYELRSKLRTLIKNKYIEEEKE